MSRWLESDHGNIASSPVSQCLFIVILVALLVKAYGENIRRFWKSWSVEKEEIKERLNEQLAAAIGEKNASKLVATIPGRQSDESGNLDLYKDLYFKLHNLERYPEILPQARDRLISLFAETIAESSNSLEPGILSIGEFSPDALETFLQIENDKIVRRWEQYVLKRRAGSPLELFEDKAEAEWWLRQIAPVKYVDGAWLGYINKITTPFALRRVTKDAFQVLSEELGDGKVHMNHVYVYRELMRGIGAGLPEAHDASFIHPDRHLDEVCVWKAAVAQLLISLFPHDFLPEILGFNMHFEGLTMDTMRAAKEVEDVGLDPYYFVLHISIDNADSGHTAIAMNAVMKYMELIRQTEGEASVRKAWRRVQTGFLLSNNLSGIPKSPSRRPPAADSFPRNAREAEIIKIFKAKAPVAHKIHCGSRIRFGGRKLDDWLEPQAFSNKEWQMDFLDHLSNLRPWVRKGDSSNSKLVTELLWGGKMFGSFTQSEVEVVQRWINALGDPDPSLYWSFIGADSISSKAVLEKQDLRIDSPVLSPGISLPWTDNSYTRSHTTAGASFESPDMSILLPIWFTNPCLLESFISIPSKTTTPIASSIVRHLRAQCGFDDEGSGVAGMDEARREDSVGLVELGSEIMCEAGLEEPASLKTVLDAFPSAFALKMLELSVRPMAHFGLLLGLAWSFVSLHDALTSSVLLSAKSQAILMQIVRRERDSMRVCYKELKNEADQLENFFQGYRLGRAEIGRCFGRNLDEQESISPNELP